MRIQGRRNKKKKKANFEKNIYGVLTVYKCHVGREGHSFLWRVFVQVDKLDKCSSLYKYIRKSEFILIEEGKDSAHEKRISFPRLDTKTNYYLFGGLKRSTSCFSEIDVS